MKQHLSLFQIRKIPFYLLLLFSLNIFSQQNYYWVGGSGNWSNYSSHWATSTGGAIFHTTSPGSEDNVIFDNNSFNGENQTVTLDTDNESVGDISWFGVSNNPTFNMSGKTLMIYGSVTYDPEMVISSPGTHKFSSVKNSALISAGHNTGNLDIDKSGGVFSQLDNFNSSNRSLYVRSGSTYNSNDYDLSFHQVIFYGSPSGSVTTTINTGVSKITIDGYRLEIAADSNNRNMITDFSSSTIHLKTAELSGSYYRKDNFGHIISEDAPSWRSVGYHVDRIRKFEIIQNSTNYQNDPQVISTEFGSYHDNNNRGGIIDTLIINKYTRFNTNYNPVVGDIQFKGNALTVEFGTSGTLTVSNSMSFDGGGCSVTTFKSTSGGNQATLNLLSTDTVTATNLSLRDMAFTGSGTLVAQASVDQGNNSGVAITQLDSRNLYWVGGSGNWSDSNHWSLSDGGSGGQCAPTPNDNVYFTSNSFSNANQVITLDIDNNGIVNLDWTGVTNSPQFNMTSKSLEISGSVTYTADMSISSPGTLKFITNSNSFFTSAGHNTGNLDIDKSGGVFSQLDNFNSSNRSLYVRSGSTYNSNDYDLSFHQVIFYGSPSGSVTTTINTGVSKITIDGYRLEIAADSNNRNMITDFSSSTIHLKTAELSGSYYRKDNFGHIISEDAPSWRSVGYHVDRIRKFEIIQNSTNYQNDPQVISTEFGSYHDNNNRGGIIDTLIINKYTRFNTNYNPVVGDIQFKGNALTVEFGTSGTLTVSNSMSFDGGGCSVTTFKSTSGGNQATLNLLSTDTVTATNLSLRDMAFTGSGTLVAQASVDQGNNSGVAITQLDSRNLYWVGGSGNWSDSNHWSLSDGGSGGQCAPTPNDNVYFTSNSFSNANQVITLDIDNNGIVNLDWTGVTNSPQFNMTSKSLEISGSVTYTADMSISSPGTLKFITNSNSFFTSAGHNTGNLDIDKSGGVFSQLDNFNSSNRSLYVRSGSTYNSNDYDLSFHQVIFYGSPSGSVTTTINTGVSKITIDGYRLEIAADSNNRNMITDFSSSTIHLKTAELSGSYYRKDNFGHIISEDAPSWRSVGYHVDRIRKFEIIQNSTNYQNDPQVISTEFGSYHDNNNRGGIIDTLIINKYTRFNTNYNPVVGNLILTGDGTTLEIGTSGSLTVSNSLNLGSKTGTRNFLMSTTSGNQANINYNGLDFCGDYIRIRDISLTTSATAILGPYSQNEGNTSGFNFNTDSSNTINGMSITTSPTGGSFYDNQLISFVISSTYTGNSSTTFHFFVNSENRQSGSSNTFAANNLVHGDKVFGSVEIPYSGTVTGCDFSTIGKTDELTLSLNQHPLITSTTFSENDSTIAVTFNKPVFTENSGNGTLIPSDFELSITGGTATLNSNQPTSVSKNGNTYTLGIDVSNLAGNEVLTVRPENYQIFDNGGRNAHQNQNNNAVRLGSIPAQLSSLSLTPNNKNVKVTFSESVFSNSNGSGALEPSDFILEMTGGTATLSSTTPKSVFQDNFTYSLGLEINGVPDGNEVLKVRLADNAVFDIQGVNLSEDNDSSSNSSSQNGNNLAYISARKGGSIQVIDVSTDTLSTTIGPISSNSNWRNNERTIGISDDNQYLFQDCYDCGGGTKLIKTSDHSDITNISSFSDKSGMVSSPDGQKIYTARAYYIKVYDVLNGTVSDLANRNTGTCDPSNPNEAYQSVRLAINSEGSKLYVANLDPRKKGISVYDTSNGSETKINSAISGATRLTISPDDKYVYVLNTSWGYGACSNDPSLMTDINGNENSNYSNYVAVVDTNTNNVIDYIDVGGGNDITINKDGSNIYIANSSSIKIIERNLNNNSHSLGSSEISISSVTDFEVDPSGTFMYAITGNTSLKKHVFSSGVTSDITTTADEFLGNIVFTKPESPTTPSVNLNPDSDADGIADPIDLCPGTASGTAVNMNGCADDAQNYFWVGGTGNWSNYSNHWSTTSGGNVFHSRAPNSADNIYFDESSFDSSDQVVTIDIDNAACKNMSWASVTNTPKFDYQSKSLRVHGSYELSENMTIQSDRNYFTGTASVTLDSKGQRMNYVYIDGSDVSLSGPLDTSGGGLYTNSGVLTTNNYDINTGNYWYANVTQNATMTINLGTSSITCTYQHQAHERNINNGQNNNSYGDLIMNNASATFIFKGNYFRNYAEIPWPRIITDRNEGDVYFDRYGDIDSLIQRGNGKIRLSQTWRDNGGPHGNHLNKIGYMEVKNTASFSGNVSFTTLKLLGNGSIYTFGSNYSYSVSDTFIMGQSGSCAITTVKSSSPGTTAHISSSDVVASSYLDMQDISFSGTGSFMANNSIDNGNNSGITFGSLSERDFYWIGGTGNWSDGSKWSLSSGGSPVGCPPTSADNIYFDESSFDSSDQVVTIDIDNAACKNMSWASVTNTPKFDYQSKSLRVHGSYELSENMTIQSDRNYFTGTASVTLDSKGQRMNYVYIDGSDVSLSGPLDTSGGGLYTNSGVLTTNNYDINTGNYWYANVTQNATMTINLGTSSITCTYQHQAHERNINNGQNNNSYGDLIMNNASATFIFKGNYFRNYAEIPWPRIITDRNEGDVYFDRYGDIDSLIQRGNGKIRLSQTWRDNGGPHGNHLNKIGYMEVKNTASFSGNVSFTTLKLLGNGSIYTFGSNYSYSVSDSFELNSPFGEVCTIKSSSNGSQTDISLGNISACIDYTSVQDVNFSSTTTVTAGPNSNDAGNNSGIQFFTDNSTTFQGINIISNVGTSIPDFQEGSFTATTTTGFPEGAVLNWYVNQELKQSGSSPHFSAGIIDHDYTVNCTMEMSYTGSSGNCSFAIKGKSNNIDMSVSRNPIIRETLITPDNQFIKVKFSKPVYTNSDGTGDLTTNDFRLYLNGGNAILSSSYPNSVSKEGEYYKLTFGLNNKLNGEEEITVKPHGDNNIYDNSGLKAYQNQSNNVVTLNYNPPIIDGVSVNSTFDEITVKWSEPVNGSDQPPFDQPVRYNSYHLSVTGGTATLNSTLPLSISGGVDTYVLKFALTGTPNGDEIFMVRPVYNSIFDLQGFAASHLQSYNSTCSNCDGDNDGLIDALDLCPNTPAGATIDQNGCSEDQKDSDYDGVPDYLDFCLNTPLGTEVEANGCEPEQEAPVTPPLTNEDSNSNDTSSEDQTTTVVIVNVNDRDNDGVENDQDQFPDDPNEFEDTDQDGTGDNADQDDDNDGFSDIVESQCETNSMDPQSVPLDSDQDQIADCIDKDDDNDGVPDNQDLFPLDDTEYLDTDEDGIGNNADQDDDNDLYLDVDEISCDSDPLKKRDTPKDFDKDLIPDCIDEDDDNDGCLDEEDLFPYNGDECSDVDGDGIGDNADMDADNDGVIDALDDFPTNANESKDTDGDGIGDNADQDDNNDGFPEEPITNSAGEKVIPIFISEILSPNQPGEESTWKIVNIDKYPTANVKIYTPTGIVVYESWNYKNDWNGSNKNGKPLPTGPYMYMIDRGDETQVEQGWLYIFN